MSGLIYIANPYSHSNGATVHARYQVVLEACAFFKNLGHCVYSPIMHWHECAKVHEMPTDYRSWEHDNEIMLRKSDLLRILDLPGINESKGTAREICWANQWGIPIEVYDPSGFEAFAHFQKELMV